MLPPDLLNSAVAITLTATEPAKNGVKDQAPCGVPLKRNAGKCQNPQITPRTRPAHKGASFRCSRGKASPLQPSSSTGPLIAVKNIASMKALNEENGNDPGKGSPFRTELP